MVDETAFEEMDADDEDDAREQLEAAFADIEASNDLEGQFEWLLDRIWPIND